MVLLEVAPLRLLKQELFECSDCSKLFDEKQIWFHNCDGSEILDAEYFKKEPAQCQQ